MNARSRSSFAVLLSLSILLPILEGKGALQPGDAFPSWDHFQLEGALPETAKARVVLVDFWASWCAPCKESFATLNDLHRRFAPQGLVIIGVNVDEKQADMARFLAKHRADFVVVRDAKQKLVATVAVETMPASFIIDAQGKVRHVHRGYRGDETPKQYEQEIAGLLGVALSKP